MCILGKLISAESSGPRHGTAQLGQVMQVMAHTIELYRPSAVQHVVYTGTLILMYMPYSLRPFGRLVHGASWEFNSVAESVQCQWGAPPPTSKLDLDKSDYLGTGFFRLLIIEFGLVQ